MTSRLGQFIVFRRPGLMVLAANLFALLVVLFAACVTAGQPPEPTPAPLILVAASGGDTTAFTATRNAFGLPARNLSTEERRTFAVGNSFFRQN